MIIGVLFIIGSFLTKVKFFSAVGIILIIISFFRKSSEKNYKKTRKGGNLGNNKDNCKNCGEIIFPDDNYCQNCGKKVLP